VLFKGLYALCILRILKHPYILIIQNHRCIKCVIIYIILKLYSGHVINTHRLFKYNNNIDALKNLNALVRLIIQVPVHYTLVTIINNGHKIQAHQSCIQQNGNLGHINHNHQSVFVSYVSIRGSNVMENQHFSSYVRTGIFM
jgi:hypothetical protein